MAWLINYTSPNGEVFDLTEINGDVVVMEAGIEGLVGHPTRHTTPTVRGVGVRQNYLTTPEVAGVLHIMAESNLMAELYPRLRAAFSPDEAGVLGQTLQGQRFEMEVLQNAALPWPITNPEDETQQLLDVPLAGEDGVWLAEPGQGTGVVNVTNPGDVLMWVEFVWGPDPASVMLPSGALFSLPTVTGQRILTTDPSQSSAVLTMDRTLDRELSATITALPEAVPPKQTRTFTATGATIQWRVGWWDPIKAVA